MKTWLWPDTVVTLNPLQATNLCISNLNSQVEIWYFYLLKMFKVSVRFLQSNHQQQLIITKNYYIPQISASLFTFVFLLEPIAMNHDILLFYRKWFYGFRLFVIFESISTSYQRLRYRTKFLHSLKRIYQKDKVLYHFLNNSYKIRKQKW